MPKYTVPFLSGLPVVGGLFKSQTIVAYFSVLFVVITWFILFRTKEGMKIRACGENPQAAAAVGYDVRKIQFLCSVITSTACGLAGAHLSLGLVTLFAEKMTAGKGFIALAVVTFGGGSLWKVMAISGPVSYTHLVFRRVQQAFCDIYNKPINYKLQSVIADGCTVYF